MRPLSKIVLAVIIAVFTAGSPAAEPLPAQSRWLTATPKKLPRWRGFNLLEKFYLSSGRRPFLEEDFRLISKLGFNFVRLPMDYRCWIRSRNWEEFDETTLAEIDQAVAWGEKYGIHVCINFHRHPVTRLPTRRSGPTFGPIRKRNGCVQNTGLCLPAATEASPTSDSAST